MSSGSTEQPGEIYTACSKRIPRVSICCCLVKIRESTASMPVIFMGEAAKILPVMLSMIS